MFQFVPISFAHKNISLKSRWKIRTSLWLWRPRAMESISTCSNKLHAKFASRGGAVYRANELNFSICNISHTNYLNYKFLTQFPMYFRTCLQYYALVRYFDDEKADKIYLLWRHVSKNCSARIEWTYGKISHACEKILSSLKFRAPLQLRKLRVEFFADKTIVDNCVDKIINCFLLHKL